MSNTTQSRKSKTITYNIKERGRTHAGQDRSNVNVRSMVDTINSPATQELVNTGDMYGYYGHELRALYGMNPPDTVVTDDGREIRIAPAIRTIKLSADKDGNVTHQQEFLQNEAGEYAYQQYKAGIGGFSSAVNFTPMRDGSRVISGFYGFDYVRNPNYHTNKGAGLFDALFDGLQTQDDPALLQVKHALKDSLVAQYDSIYSQIQSQGLVDYYQQEAIAAQDALNDYIRRQEARAKRKQEREAQLLDSLICPSVPFEQFAAQFADFDALELRQDLLKTSDELKAQAADKPRNSMMGTLRKFWG